jgi:uncharacterized protein
MSGARPLQVGVSELLRHPGSRRPFEADVVLDGLALSTAQVVPGSPVHVELVLESLSSSITATGTVSVTWEGDCRRCLEPVEGDAEAEVHAEVFEAVPTEGETYPLVGEQIDLEPLVRDAVLLALPLAPLCAETCAGPAPEEFPTGPAVEGAEPRDPRWAALDELSFEE